MSNESYVVRIYRKEAPVAERGKRWPFHDIETLWAILAGSTRKGRDETGWPGQKQTPG